jgi:hypothetical protein
MMMFLTGKLDTNQFLCSNILLQVRGTSFVTNYVGSAAGVVEHVGMFPVDTVKVSENIPLILSLRLTCKLPKHLEIDFFSKK